MSVYFNSKKVAEQQDEESEARLRELVEKEKNEETAKQLIQMLFELFVNPLVVMVLLNWLLPFTGLVAIGYLQSFALCWVCRILFK
jgi:Flp pilus assembly protein TadB